MALTVTPMYKWAWGNSEFMTIIQVTGDATYATGGYPITREMFHYYSGFASTSDSQLQAPPANPVFVLASGGHSGAGLGGYAEIDNTNGNLLLFAPGGAQVTNGTSAVTYTAVLMAYGH